MTAAPPSSPQTSAPNGFGLAEEAPLDEDGLQRFDGGRLQGAIGTLDGLLQRYFQNGYRTNTAIKEGPRQAFVVGVLGGLGQGKTTVLEAVLRRLTVSTCIGQGPEARAPRVARIDASLLDAKSLDESLLKEIAKTGRIQAAINILMFVVFALFVSMLVGAAVKQDAWWLISGLIWIITVSKLPKELYTMASKWLTSLPAGQQDRFIARSAQRLGAWPDLIVVDDLDRAKLDQQRAILRSLLRHAQALRCAVVVCFDESELLDSKPDPEAPEELLRKIIHLSVRIPYRTREDCVWIAYSVVRQWRQAHEGVVVSAGLDNLGLMLWDLRVVSALAQSLSLLGNVGPRRAKALWNETLSSLAQRGIDGTQAWSRDVFIGLLFLSACNQIHPRLGHRSEPFARLLDSIQASSLSVTETEVEEFLKLHAEDLPAPRRLILKALIQESSRFAAPWLYWRRLLQVARFDGSDELPSDTSHFAPPRAELAWDNLRCGGLWIDATLRGLMPSREASQAIELKANLVFIWPLLCTQLLYLTPLERGRLLRAYIERAKAAYIEPVKSPQTESFADIVALASASLLADDAAARPADLGQYLDLLKGKRGAPDDPLAVFGQGARSHVADAPSFAKALKLSQDNGFSAQVTAMRHERRSFVRLASGQPPLSLVFTPEIFELLRDHWPRVRTESISEHLELARHWTRQAKTVIEPSPLLSQVAEGALDDWDVASLVYELSSFVGDELGPWQLAQCPVGLAYGYFLRNPSRWSELAAFPPSNVNLRARGALVLADLFASQKTEGNESAEALANTFAPHQLRSQAAQGLRSLLDAQTVATLVFHGIAEQWAHSRYQCLWSDLPSLHFGESVAVQLYQALRERDWDGEGPLGPSELRVQTWLRARADGPTLMAALGIDASPVVL